MNIKILPLVLLLSSCVTTNTPNNPELGKTYLRLANAYLAQNRTSLAHDKATKALQMVPNDPEVSYTQGLIYERAGDLDQAEYWLAQAIDAQPDYYQAQNAYAVVLCRQGKYAQGQKILKDLSRNKSWSTPHFARDNLEKCHANTTAD